MSGAVFRRDSLGRRIWDAAARPPGSCEDLAVSDPERPEQFARAYAGREPADALTSRDRRLLVVGLWEKGWPDERIARHTQMTVGTTERIRTALGLAAHQHPR